MHMQAREGQRERVRERVFPLTRLQVDHRAQYGAQSHNREIMTQAEIKSRTPNGLSHPGAPSCAFSTWWFIFLCIGKNYLTTKGKQTQKYLPCLQGL